MKKEKYIDNAPYIIISILIIAFSYTYYKYDLISKRYSLEKNNLETDIKNLTKDKIDLENNLTDEQNKNHTFANQIGEISQTIGTLNKLSKTDKELLQKYSKIYFLNEHYIPESLSEIPPDFINEKGKKIQIHSKVLGYLQDMISTAKSENINISIISGYRSFGDQGVLKNGYVVKYGTGSNTFSADQGFSEHQLGTALDLTTQELGSSFTKFENAKAYEWMLANAYKFGFVLSYPKNNKFYVFEPWHWRFVGKNLAKRLHEDNQNFYDVDQRIIDQYLVSIFD